LSWARSAGHRVRFNEQPRCVLLSTCCLLLPAIPLLQPGLPHTLEAAQSGRTGVHDSLGSQPCCRCPAVAPPAAMALQISSAPRPAGQEQGPRPARAGPWPQGLRGRAAPHRRSSSSRRRRGRGPWSARLEGEGRAGGQRARQGVSALVISRLLCCSLPLPHPAARAKRSTHPQRHPLQTRGGLPLLASCWARRR